MTTQTRVDEHRSFSPSASINEIAPRGLIVVLAAGTLVAIAFAAFALARSENVIERMEEAARRAADRDAAQIARMQDMQARFDMRVSDISTTVDARLSDAAIRNDELRRDNRIMADDLRTIRVVLNKVGLPSSHEEVEEAPIAATTMAR